MNSSRLLGTLSLLASLLVGCSGASNRGTTVPVDPDGGPAADADAGPKTALDRCPGIPLEESGARDFDVRAVKLTGKVTLNGLPLPPENVSLSFTNEASELATSLTLSDETAPYAITLTPGKYTVSYLATSSCSKTTKLPCSGGVLKKGVVLDADGVLDLDIPSVLLQGNVTLNGALMGSTESELGRMRFVDETGKNGAVATIERTSTSAPSKYSVVLFPGKYQPVYEGRDRRWPDAQAFR